MAKFIEVLSAVGETVNVLSTSFCEVGDIFTNPTLVIIPFVGRNNTFGAARAIVSADDVESVTNVVDAISDLDDSITEDVAEAKILCAGLPKRIWLKSLYKIFTHIQLEEDNEGKLTGAKRSITQKPQGTFADAIRAAYKGGKSVTEVQTIINKAAKTDRKSGNKFVVEIICNKDFTAESKEGKPYPIVRYDVNIKD